ncbi:hypothetical protein GGR55DRAFT_520333 [Xylaria sp. FL0064]|nr:hypothetical protein GGR55DRAFT_520333 [Xylaria sp. FL0064]
MAGISNVAVLGASGTLGRTIVSALLRNGFIVTAIGRPESKTLDHSGMTYKVSPYDDLATLTEALQHQDAVIEAFNPAAAVNQSIIMQASLAAGVKHLITPGFSSDTFNPYVDELKIFEPKRKAQRVLEAAVKDSNRAIAWTAIIVGAWYDWAIENGQFWIDEKSRTITKFGSGDQKTSISRLDLCGEAVVAVLRSPEQYRNRPAYFQSHSVSTNELASILKEVSGDDWKIVAAPLDGFVEKAKALWEEDSKNNVKDRLGSVAYRMLGTSALFDEGNRYDGDFSYKVEPGWDEGLDTLKENLKRLVE